MNSRELVRWLRDNDYDLRLSGAGHFKVYIDNRFIGTIPGSSNHYRGMRNTLALLRRSGIPIPHRGEK